MADQLIPRNPCASVRAPRPSRARVIPWTAERVAAVHAGLPAHYAALADAGAGLGLRQGEGFGLAVDDVDFLRRMVHVRRQVRIVGGKLVFAPPKGGKERDVPLPDTGRCGCRRTSPRTRPYRSCCRGGRRAAGMSAQCCCSRPRAAACNRNTFNHGWRDALEAAGVPLVRGNGFHALRHHFASVLLADGVDIRSLADYLGHHDPGFTLRVYAHMMPAAGERMRAAVDRVFAAPAAPASAEAQR